MDKNKIKQLKRNRRRGRIRVKVKGSASRPRLNVFRSNVSIYAQLIDDGRGNTVVSVHSREIKPGKNDKGAGGSGKNTGRKIKIGYELGRLLAAKAREKKIKTVIFDRGGYKYHGRVKAVADGARDGGLEF